MLKKLKTKDQGFTIIEVMIVLAIAGLILLIVFLAVPALQRSSRNTQRKNDVSALLGALSEYESNNGGSTPTATTQVTDNAKLGYYSGTGSGQGQVDLITGSGAAVQNALRGNSSDDRVVMVVGATCDTGGATKPGSARGVAVQYEVETSSSFSPTCQSS